MKLIFIENKNIEKRIRVLHTLSKTTLKIGLPKNNPFLRGILAIQEHGAPSKNIPPRPVIRPSLSAPETRALLSAHAQAAVSAAWQGSVSAMRKSLEAAGQTGADSIRAAIDTGVPPPNRPSTIARKGFDKPLYDTGALYRAFDYEIEESP